MTIKKSKLLMSASVALLALFVVGSTQASVKSSASEHVRAAIKINIDSVSAGLQGGSGPSIAGKQPDSKLSPQALPCAWFPALHTWFCLPCCSR